MLRWRNPHFFSPLVWLALWIIAGGAATARATVYYVAPDGKDLADGRSPDHPWQTLQRVSAAILKGGDEVLLQRAGVWRETFNVTSDGDPDHPVVIAAYGRGDRPCIDAGDPVDPAKFSAADDGLFRAQVDRTVETVWQDLGKPLTRAASRAQAAAAEGTFFCDGVWLYVHPAKEADPRSGQIHYEIPARDLCVESDRNHIALRSIAVCHAGRSDRGAITVWAADDLDGIELRDCDISFNRGRGVWLCGPPGNSIRDVRIDGNDFRGNDGSGASLVLADGAEIRGNRFTQNCRREIEPWQAAIRVWSSGIRNLLIEGNVIADQRWRHDHDSSMGIHCDETGQGVTIRGNVIRDVDHAGIEVENTRGVVVEQNDIHNCNIGIFINRAGHDHIVRNNKITDSRSQGIAVQGWSAHGIDAQPEIVVGGHLMTRNLIENNLCAHSRYGELKCTGGGEFVDGPLGNIYRGNDFGPQRPGFIEWGDRALDRYDQWPLGQENSPEK
jgi:parallel beta-helix repeat protein